MEIAAVGFSILGMLASVVLLSLNSARAKSRDTKRLADVRQIASALELYRNDYKSYPAALKTLEPVYIGIVPQAPAPADGTCSEQENQYQYAVKAQAGFELSFCLGEQAGGYAAGKHVLTQEGIK